MLYNLLRPAIFALDAETAHHLSINTLATTGRLKGPGRPAPGQASTVMGISFPNKVGLAAGLDKNGEAIDGLAGLGFGSIEIGTITPRPQPGNPKPRIFRVPEAQGIINRMGFNNQGVDALLANVAQSKFAQQGGVLGINIGKNFDTPIENAADDYLICLNKVYAAATYITVNISSPNTKNLRQLQQGDEIKHLLSALKAEQLKLQAAHGKYTPIAVKIAPDLNDDEISHIADLLLEFGMDGVIATNTTIARDKIQGHIHADEAGGLSGAPVKDSSTRVVKALATILQGKLPIIAAGGIVCAEDAQEKIAAGASLVQIYSGLIYKGPQLLEDILQQI